jgi:hypothetical protein
VPEINRVGQRDVFGPAIKPIAHSSICENRRVDCIQFTATLAPHGQAAAIALNDEQVAAVGEGAKRFPVTATVNNYTWRTTVTRMRGEFFVGLSRVVREAAAVEPGETVEVALELDRAPREVQVPEALAQTLASDSQARAAFDALSYTHRKEYARWIEEAKRDETHARCLDQAPKMLREGRTRS